MIWQHLLSENIARAICLALAHSLWQGTLIGVVAALILLLTKRSPAARRYAWLIGSLGLFTLSFFVTLAIELNSENPGVQLRHGATTASLDDPTTQKAFNLYPANTKSVDEIRMGQASAKDKKDALAVNSVAFDQNLKAILTADQFKHYQQDRKAGKIRY